MSTSEWVSFVCTVVGLLATVIIAVVVGYRKMVDKHDEAMNKIDSDHSATKSELSTFKAEINVRIGHLENGHREVKEAVGRVEDLVAGTRELLIAEFSAIKERFNHVDRDARVNSFVDRK